MTAATPNTRIIVDEGGNTLIQVSVDSIIWKTAVSVTPAGVTTIGTAVTASIGSGELHSNDAGGLIYADTALTTGAGVATGTLLNAPAAGNPTKWLPINDAGTVRFVPAW
jgi:hypothetical protein